MAQTATTVEEVKTGHGVGPVTATIGLSQAVVLVIVWSAGQLGVDVPADVALAVATILAFVVGYFTKGRALVEKTLPPEPAVSVVPTDIAAADYQPKHAA